jgi:hypothetical protein
MERPKGCLMREERGHGKVKGEQRKIWEASRGHVMKIRSETRVIVRMRGVAFCIATVM